MSLEQPLGPMANHIKRLKGYLAPLLLLYTVAVTLFLAQTAWNDGTSSGGDGGNGGVTHRKGRAKFLDVLVQEERRHMKSFESIVQIDGLQKSKTARSVEEERALKNASGGDPSFRKGYRVLMEPRHHRLTTRIDANDSDSPEVLPTQKNDEDPSLGRHETKKRPTFKVEVEDWDALGKQERNSTLANVSGKATDTNSALAHKTYQNSYQRLKKAKTSVEQRVGFHPSEVTYSLEYCDDVFDHLAVASPNICRRDLVMKGSLDYVEPSKYFLPFKNLADVSIYAAFLDHRGKEKVVRIIALGPQGRDGEKSVFECVFYRSVRISYDVRNEGNSTVKLKKVPQTTQLTYWAASAGHKTPQQFYIMTCDVPETALESFYPPNRGAMKIAVRKTDGLSQTDHTNQSIAVNVINNLPGSYDETKPFNKQMYFNRMEEELMKFTHTDVERDYHSNQTVNTFDNIVNSRQNISGDISHNTANVLTSGANQAPKPMAPGLDRIVACVAPLQGNVGVIQMVEYIELTLLLGAQHLVIYTFRVFDEVRAVLNMYEARGLITVLPWNIPDPSSVWAKGRDAALNDCLYRTMHLFDHALFLDLDEFFVPRVTPDMPSFLKYLRQVHNFNSTKITDIVFSSAYFPPPTKADFQNLSQISGAGKDVAKFLSLRSVRRSYYNQQHTLRMIRPDAAYRVGSGERRKTSYTISTRYASVHHYSYCPRAATSSTVAPHKGANGTLSGSVDQKGSVKINSVADFCAHTKVDWIMWRYRSKLIERTKQSVRHLNT